MAEIFTASPAPPTKTYKFSIKNENDSSYYFAVYPTVPGAIHQFNTKGTFEPLTPFTGPLEVTKAVSGGHGTTTMTVNSDLYVMCGTSNAVPDVGVPITVGDSRVLPDVSSGKPGTHVTMTMPADSGASFTNDPQVLKGIDGVFVAVDDSYESPSPNNPVVGIGAMNLSTNSVVAIATVKAEPTCAYTFSDLSRNKFVLTSMSKPVQTGSISYSHGTTINVEFKGGYTTANAVLSKDGQLSISYT